MRAPDGGVPTRVQSADRSKKGRSRRPGRPATPPAPPPPPAAPPAPTPAALTEEEIFARKSLDQLNSERPLSDVFFDLDKSDIRDEARSVLQRDADWMKRWTSTMITVE